jgi:hypothetical protein
LKCQTVEEYDELLKQCFEDVTKAVNASVKERAAGQPPKSLKIFGTGSGWFFSMDSLQVILLLNRFCDAVCKMVQHEVGLAKTIESSVSPWEAMLHPEFDGKLTFEISRCTALQRKYRMSRICELNQIRGKFKVLFILADLGNHPTTHLMAGEHIELKLDSAEVFVMCVADSARLENFVIRITLSQINKRSIWSQISGVVRLERCKNCRYNLKNQASLCLPSWLPPGCC